jgi:hypothetical protein
MNFNLDTCKYIVWGLVNTYHTHKHIHEAFYRTLKLLGKQVLWLDAKSNLSGIDFSNTLFISYNDCVRDELGSIPLRKDCFYVIHNNIYPNMLSSFDGLNRLNWGVHLGIHNYDEEKIVFAPGTIYYPGSKTVNFSWATDLMPSEIMANKPSRVFRSDSKIVYFVTSSWNASGEEVKKFEKACNENGITFEWTGKTRGPVTIEENIRLIKESYMAPALSCPEHCDHGYIPCRIFKNISYGQYGITNSKWVRDVFDGHVIFHSDPYQLFYEAREKLPQITLAELYAQMDFVAQNHTYVNRIEALSRAIRIILENK